MQIDHTLLASHPAVSLLYCALEVPSATEAFSSSLSSVLACASESDGKAGVLFLKASRSKAPKTGPQQKGEATSP